MNQQKLEAATMCESSKQEQSIGVVLPLSYMWIVDEFGDHCLVRRPMLQGANHRLYTVGSDQSGRCCDQKWDKQS